MVQKIVNKSHVGFMVVLHSDTSSCSLHKKNILINADDTLAQDFLLEPSVKIFMNAKKPVRASKKKAMPQPRIFDKASLILRPVYYYDEVADLQIPLLNNQYQFDDEKVEQAFAAWKQSGKKRKFAHAQEWLERWIGKDIVVIPDGIEASGYIMHLSRIYIGNAMREHGQWLSFAKGVFSRLMVDIEINEHARKGIIPLLKVTAGEGGICTNGIVDRI